jgi:hypothetical protein
MDDVRLHRDAVDAFCAGRLDRSAEAQLALQVAHVYVCEPILPNSSVVMIGRISRHLGGQDAVLAWLGQFEGEPRFTAAVIDLADLLGALSGNNQVLDALRTVRDRPEFRRFASAWAATTDHVTLIDLAETGKHLLRNRRMEAASSFSDGVVRLLEEVLALVGEQGGDVAVAQDYLTSVAQQLAQAKDEMNGTGRRPTQTADDGAAPSPRRPLLGRSRRRVALD